MAEKMRKMKPRRAGDGQESSSVKLAWLVGAIGLCILLISGIAIASGGREKQAPSIRAQEGDSSTAPAAPATSVPAAPKAKIESVEVPPLTIYRRRNPFAPLVNMETAKPGTTSVPTAGAGPASTVTVPAELRTGSSPVPETQSLAITLDSVKKQDGKAVARIRVGDQVFDGVAIGQDFAEHYKVLSIGSDSSATILFGDERFTIFAGQSIYP